MSVILIVFIVGLLFFIGKGIIIVRQSEVMIIERLGRFHKKCDSGLHFIVPIIDAKRYFDFKGRMVDRIDLREQVMDFDPQPVITKDNVTMQVDSVIYFQVVDPQKAVYEISNITFAIRQLAITNIRNIMGELALDETLTSREKVNSTLQIALDEATDPWGIKVTRVELKNINPPSEIEEAMTKQMKAERERRAMVTNAEGVKTAQILQAEGNRDAEIAKAEGDKQSQILKAQGKALAILEVQKAEAQAINMIFNAIHEGRATEDVLAVKYLETMQKIAEGPSNKVFMPYQTADFMSSVGAMIDLAKTRDEVKK